jgi:chitinase
VVGPYCYKGDQWFGFDDEHSIEAKAEYALANDLAGAMVWSIDTDDFQGFCGRKNGLIEKIAEVPKAALKY